MVPKVEGPWDIHYVDRLLAQLEAQAQAAAADPGARDPRDRARRHQRRGDLRREPAHAGRQLRPRRPRGVAPHEDDARRRRPPGVPRAHRSRSEEPGRAARRPRSRIPWHYSIARMVDACAATGALPFYGPFGDISDPLGCEDQFRAAFLLGCVGAWSLHPSQIDDRARRCSARRPTRSLFAKKVLEAMPDGRGVAHARRQDAGRRHLEAVQGDGEPREAARREGPGAEGGVRALSMLTPRPSRRPRRAAPRGRARLLAGPPRARSVEAGDGPRSGREGRAPADRPQRDRAARAHRRRGRRRQVPREARRGAASRLLRDGRRRRPSWRPRARRGSR